MPNSVLSPCPGCGALFPEHDGPTHRYIGVFVKSGSMESDAISHASTLWDYLSSFSSVGPADAVAVCCSYDLRVCDYACGLVRQGIADTLVLSGNTGNWTRHLWRRPEAEVFAERALENGLPSAIVIENRATNFGENVSFTRDLLRDAKAVVFVTKPASVLRVILTAKSKWPDIAFHVSSPSIRFPYEVSNVVGVWASLTKWSATFSGFGSIRSSAIRCRMSCPPTSWSLRSISCSRNSRVICCRTPVEMELDANQCVQWPRRGVASRLREESALVVAGQS